MATVSQSSPIRMDDPLRQSKVDHAGIISKANLQYSLIIFFLITTLSFFHRFRGRAPARRADDSLAICAAFLACLGTGILLYKLPTMYLMEATNMRRISLYPEEIDSVMKLVEWTLALGRLIWFSVFSSQFSLLCTFSKSISRLSKSYRYYFRAVSTFTACISLFRSSYLTVACSSADRGDTLECLSTFPMSPGSRNEERDQFISSLAGKLDILSDCLVFSFIIVIRSCGGTTPASKAALITVIFLFLLKTIVSAFRFDVTNPYMGYPYTWAIYCQILEAYLLIIMGSVVVRSPTFEIPEQSYTELSAEDNVEHKG